MTSPSRWNVYNRRKNHALVDRCRTLARQGKSDDEISTETGLPYINVRAITYDLREKAESAVLPLPKELDRS